MTSKGGLGPLHEYKTPYYLKYLVELQELLCNLDKNNFKETLDLLKKKFNSTDKSAFYTSILNLIPTHPLQTDLYADLWANFSRISPSTFDISYLADFHPLFFRRLVIRKVYTLEQVMHEIDREGPTPIDFFFAPEFEIEQCGVPPEYQELQYDWFADNFKALRDIYDCGYSHESTEYAIIIDDPKLLESRLLKEDPRLSKLLAMSALYLSPKCFKALRFKGAIVDDDVCEKAFYGGNQDLINQCIKENPSYKGGPLAALGAFRNKLYDEELERIGNDPEYVEPSFVQVMDTMNAQAIYYFIRKNVDVNTADPDTLTTPMHLACSEGVEAYLKLLNERKAGVDGRDVKGALPVQFLYEHKFSALTKYVVPYTSEFNETLELACKFGDVDTVHTMIQRGADIKSRLLQRKYLVGAIKNGHNDALNVLLKAGIPPDVTFKAKKCPLICACKFHNLEAVKMLVDAGADVNIHDEKTDGTPLGMMIFEPDFVEYFVEHGADINGRYAGPKYSTPLTTALDHGEMFDSFPDRERVIEILLSHGADVNASNYQFRSPLHIASEMGDIPLMEDLLDRGADMEYRNTTGYNPVQVAVVMDQWEAVELLIKRGTNLMARMPGAGKVNNKQPNVAELLYNQRHPEILEQAPDRKAVEEAMKRPKRKHTRPWILRKWQKIVAIFSLVYWVYNELVNPRLNWIRI